MGTTRADIERFCHHRRGAVCDECHELLIGLRTYLDEIRPRVAGLYLVVQGSRS